MTSTLKVTLQLVHDKRVEERMRSFDNHSEDKLAPNDDKKENTTAESSEIPKFDIHVTKKNHKK